MLSHPVGFDVGRSLRALCWAWKVDSVLSSLRTSLSSSGLE